mmetsp:Transcript_52319/g.126529  ORF Transcript_52319/g.126529 Transcript_52319/m.126529 type:complete len:84 (+) Transcript_52319:239-490(+)
MYKKSGGRFFNFLNDDDDELREDADVVCGEVSTDTAAIFLVEGDDGDWGVSCLRNAMDDAVAVGSAATAAADADGPIATIGGA